MGEKIKRFGTNKNPKSNNRSIFFINNTEIQDTNKF